MTRTLVEKAARYAILFPDGAMQNDEGHRPSADERIAFARYGLSKAARNVAMYSARRFSVTAAACYAAIRRSL